MAVLAGKTIWERVVEVAVRRVGSQNKSEQVKRMKADYERIFLITLVVIGCNLNSGMKAEPATD